ncbi:MAG TPA: RcpC/CpaB family pilus assembly protein, partial [Candidatus Omnitrophota bacterium]|nr:RcpC/CpaB family pilus assembly protein [Candidatus Omnitrophota bacterium]
QNVSSMVFQNVQILAVGTNLQAPGGYEQQQTARSLNITFALTPEEASLMSFIEKHGRMQLILRAPAETETEIIQAASWSALADYVFEKQGTELIIPKERAVIQPVSTGRVDEVKPFIQIFQGGRSL